MIGFIRFADNLSAWFGKAFAWLIVLMAFGTGYEVVVRYVFNNPTAWSLDGPLKAGRVATKTKTDTYVVPDLRNALRVFLLRSPHTL